MVKRLLIALAVIIALSGVGYGANYLTRPQTSVEAIQLESTIEPITISELHRLVNLERSKAGLQPLTLDERLNASAQIKADDMVADGYYNHVDPVTGVSGYEIVVETTGADCSYASENLNNMATTHTSVQIVESWMSSKPHRLAILDTRYELVGYAVSGEYTVQHFCDLR